MKIRLLVSRAGIDFSQNRGDVIEVSDREAIAMIEQGQAVPETEEAQERAVRRKPVERRGG
ncbi:MAG: hypothetical protein ACK5X3_05905 [Pseudomonadota bacterium]|jgi:hypothetical protein